MFVFYFLRDMAKIAYGSQKAWLLNASLKENILFGNDYNQQRSVICCVTLLLFGMSALTRDLHFSRVKALGQAKILVLVLVLEWLILDVLKARLKVCRFEAMNAKMYWSWRKFKNNLLMSSEDYVYDIGHFYIQCTLWAESQYGQDANILTVVNILL